MTGRFRGVGQVIDAAGHKRAPWFSAISAPPSGLGNWSSFVTAFDGDLSKAQIAMEHRVTGATTLSQPATGYYQGHEEGPHLIYLYNESGWNQQTGSNDGRTGLAALTVYTHQAGQGDLEAFYGNSFVTGTKAGATSFLANPAGAVFAGQVEAGSAGVYLNPFELVLDDGGFDVAGIGAVYNLKRTVNTGALDVLWNGVRVASTGAVPIDVGFLVIGSTGGTQVGLDLSNAGLQATGTWINAAITLSQNQRIYFQASGTDAGASIYRRPSSTGTTYMTYDSGLSAISFVVGNSAALQLKSNQVTAAQNINLAAGKVLEVANTQVVTARQTGWTACTGTALRGGWATGSATLVQVAETVKALVDDLLAHGLIGA